VPTEVAEPVDGDSSGFDTDEGETDAPAAAPATPAQHHAGASSPAPTWRDVVVSSTPSTPVMAGPALDSFTPGSALRSSKKPWRRLPASRQVEELEATVEDAQRELSLLRRRHVALLAEVEEAKRQGLVLNGSQVRQLKEQLAESGEALDALRAELAETQAALARAQAALGLAEAENERLASELETARACRGTNAKQAQAVEALMAERDSEAAHWRKLAEAAQAELAAVKERAETDRAERRRLNELLQDLKGNIRVFCRVRPVGAAGYARPSGHSASTSRYEFVSTDELNIMSTRKSQVGGRDEERNTKFTFNRVFAPGATQDEVYGEIEGLVQSALDGYNVCVFAYGQTGAGKTYTMEGPSPEQPGVIPRSVEQVFAHAARAAQHGWKYRVKADFIEVYQEELYDLLATPSSMSRTTARETHGSRPALKVQQERDGTNTIKDLTTIVVNSPAHVYELLARAATVRATTATDMNDRSSRSHSIFQMRIEGKNSRTCERTMGVLNLVDLAGSERVSRSHAREKQLAEAQCINTSLTTLGSVIRALADKSSHVPYRSSKLTRILEPYLSGNSKVLMFVNISMDEDDTSESLSSLNFAAKVNATELGKAQKTWTQGRR
jgi:kinesin family protein C1